MTFLEFLNLGLNVHFWGQIKKTRTEIPYRIPVESYSNLKYGPIFFKKGWSPITLIYPLPWFTSAGREPPKPAAPPSGSRTHGEKYPRSGIPHSDFENNICEQFSVWVKKSMYGKSYMGIQRSTFIINEKCKVLKIWDKVKVPNHASEVLKTLSELS